VAGHGLSLAAYSLLTAVFTLAFVFERGAFAETGWFVNAQSPTMAALFWPDPSRPFMQPPITISYWLTGGSYLGVFVLYALSILFTGVLTERILLTVAPQQPALAFLAGAFAIVHGGDQSTNLFSMVVLRQGIVGILLAALMAQRYLEHGRTRSLIWVVVGQAVALWSYDAALGLVLGLFLLFLLFPRPSDRRWRIAIACWVLAPGVYFVQLAYRYLLNSERSYQSAKVIMPSSATVVERLKAYADGGLVFWHWPEHWLAIARNCVDSMHAILTPWLVAGVIGFAIALGIALRRPATGPRRASIWSLLMGAVVVLLASYSPYLFVSDGGGNWRTQFYAAPASATVLAIVIAGIGAVRIARVPIGWIVAAPVAITIVGYGLYAGLASQLEQSYRWHLYRTVVNGIVESAPQLRQHSLVVLKGIPDIYPATICSADPFPDPFLDNWWFEAGLRVLYPRTDLSTYYYLGEDKRSNSTTWLDWTPARVRLMTRDTSVDTFRYDEVVVFNFDPRTGSQLLTEVPAALLKGVVPEGAGYQPTTAIASTEMPAETARKLRAVATHLP
jgi:hypothetical protein